MKHTAKTRISASVVFALAMIAGAITPALAQGDEAVEAAAEEAVDEDAIEVEEMVEAEDAATPEEAAPVVEAPEGAAASSDGAILAAPGSTDESNPGGTTQPSTTPDD